MIPPGLTLRSSSCRSFVILVVLVITASALLVATGMLFMMQSEAAGSAVAINAAHTRALAWSGIQLVMGRLDEQRDTLLMGDLPELDSQYELYEAAGRIGIIRLLPITPEGDLLAAEAGKIDLNHVEAASLVMTGMIDEQLARVIIDFRDQTLGRPFQSIAELLEVEGVTPEMIYGPLDELTVMDEEVGRGGVEGMAMQFAQSTPRGLADLLTVFAIEPVLQQSGDYCIPLTIEWTDELTTRFEERFGELVEDVRAIITSEKMSDESDLVRVLRERAVPVERWAELLDALSPEAGEFRFGRLDINSASYESLLSIVDPDIARQIVSARDDLTPQEKASITWPLTQGIVDEEIFETLASKITTRCFTYRLRIAAGEVYVGDEDGPMRNPLICEIVIDLAAPEPRVAYLRDISMLQTAALLAINLAPNQADQPQRPDDLQESGEETDSADQGENAFADDNTAESDLFSGESPESEFDNEQQEDISGGVPEQRANETNASVPKAASQKRIGRWKNGNANEPQGNV